MDNTFELWWLAGNSTDPQTTVDDGVGKELRLMTSPSGFLCSKSKVGPHHIAPPPPRVPHRLPPRLPPAFLSLISKAGLVTALLFHVAQRSCPVFSFFFLQASFCQHSLFRASTVFPSKIKTISRILHVVVRCISITEVAKWKQKRHYELTGHRHHKYFY